mgnify:CR=1 FL=1
MFFYYFSYLSKKKVRFFMSRIDANKCTLEEAVPLNQEGHLDDSQIGNYGYRVFYHVPRMELSKSGEFGNLPEDCVAGEIEFTVDKDGIQNGEVLLWMTVEDLDGGFTNEDFVSYNDMDVISALVDDFNNQEKDVSRS